MIEKYIQILETLAQERKGQVNWNSPIKWREQTAEHGLLGLDLPSRFGGGGCSHKNMAYLFELCGQFDLDLRDVPGLGHGRILIHNPKINEYQEKILSNVTKAQDFIAIAITEENTGSDIRNIQTNAKKVPEGYVLNGAKLYVARLEQASQVIILAKTVPSDYESITAFIVPLNCEGLQVTSLNALGLQGISFGGLELTNVFVREEMRIGDEGEGFKLFNEHFTYWRIAMAASAVGCGRAALKQAVNWLKTRNAFDGPIGRFTHLQQDLAKHHAYLEMAWLLVITAMEKLDSGQSAYVDAAMVKAEVVEIALDASDWAMKVHGAKGYTDSLDIEKRVRDLMGLRLADGTTDVLRGQVARKLLGEDLYAITLGRTPPKQP
jgi:alkylation response protein AidB-like acyl-CoA dehydrogenase